ncbi:hypothetical protein RIF29_16531 [Crotalaria pallida]|uniref:Uncharacterized protein n=1 Tax=Crotalaria pallida TaxID=3830 RepID=A0AAN9FLA7_CROPI
MQDSDGKGPMMFAAQLHTPYDEGEPEMEEDGVTSSVVLISEGYLLCILSTVDLVLNSILRVMITRHKKLGCFSEDKETKWNKGNLNWYGDHDDHSNNYSNKGQRKSGKIRRESFCEDIDGHPEQVFQATFGNRFYTWSFGNMRGSSSEHLTSGFEWKHHSTRTNINKWKSASDVESDDESCYVGSLFLVYLHQVH